MKQPNNIERDARTDNLQVIIDAAQHEAVKRERVRVRRIVKRELGDRVLRQQVLAALRLERDQWKETFERSCDDVKTLRTELAAAETVMPSTWYADRKLSERLLFLVAQWQRLHVVVKEQEQQIADFQAK